MVSPVSAEERSAFTRKVKLAVTVLVAASAALVAIQAGATPLQAVAALVAGLPVGALIAWYVVPEGTAPADRRSRRTSDGRRADGGGDDEDSEYGTDLSEDRF